MKNFMVIFSIILFSLTVNAQPVPAGPGGGKNPYLPNEEVNTQTEIEKKEAKLEQDYLNLIESMKKNWKACYYGELKGDNLVQVYRHMLFVERLSPPVEIKPKDCDGTCNKTKDNRSTYDCMFRGNINAYLINLYLNGKEFPNFFKEELGDDMPAEIEKMKQYYVPYRGLK